MEDAAFVIGVVKFSAVRSVAPADSKKCLSGQAIQRDREFLLQFIEVGGAARIGGGNLLSNGGQRQSQKGCGSKHETFPEPAGIPLQIVLGWMRHTSLFSVQVNSQH